MTPLERDVRRLVHFNGDRCVVRLVAGATPLIEFRGYRRRTAIALPLEHVLYVAARKEAERIRAGRQEKTLR
jgi:hypothetical protein